MSTHALVPLPLLFVLVAAPLSRAAVIHVPADQATIQAAVDAASGGDQIVLANGIHSGAGNRGVLVEKSVFIRSASGDPALCVVDCQGADRGFTFQGFSSAARLEDITVTHGSATHGGGILLKVSPTIRNCRILDNEATGTGGGGVAVESGAAPRLIGCMISGNEVSGTNGGAGLWNVGGSPVLINCIVSANYTVGLGLVGGGLYTTQSGSPVLANCAFYGNSAYDGSGLYCSFSSNPTVVNSIFWGNLPGSSGKPIVQALGAVASVTFSDVSGGFVGAGNFAASPVFTDVDGPDNILGNGDDDLTLVRFSPCIDAGDNSAAALAGITTDQGGDPRFMDDAGVPDTGNGSPTVDVGPRERQTESIALVIHVPADVPTIQAAVDLAGPGDEVRLADGTHSGPGNVDILVDHAIRIASASQDAAACIVDCQGAGRGFRFVGVGAGAKLEGVTVKNGLATAGGGLHLTNASPTIAACRIEDNTATGTGGGGVYCTASSPTFVNCVIRDNVASGTYGGGFYNKSGSSPVLKNCVLTGNVATGLGSTGGAMYSWTSSPSLVNCSLGLNDAYDGTALYSAYSSNPELLNCIVWGNDPGQSGNPLVDATSSVTYVASSDVQGGYAGPGNLRLDPLFLDANLRIASWSPCVDAGDNAYVDTLTDPDGSPRMSDGDGDAVAVVDMGAFEVFVEPTGVPAVTGLTGPVMDPPRPNPSTGRTMLAFELPRPSWVSLMVFDVAGRRVRTLEDGALSAGRHVTQWDGTEATGEQTATGTYFVRLTVNGVTLSRKILRVR
jgi:parallel beta-helix repeat protein